MPKGNEPGELITKDMSRFRLYNNLKRVKERFFDEYLEYVMLFDESVRGLNTGAPVEYRGIRIGTVRKVPLELPRAASGFSSKQIPVLVRIELGGEFTIMLILILCHSSRQIWNRSLKLGFGASLKTGSLLTGSTVG